MTKWLDIISYNRIMPTDRCNSVDLYCSNEYSTPNKG